MKNKFGKKSLDIFSIKKDFFTNNEELLKKQKKILTIYKKQPLRKLCKICKKKLKGDYFINHQMKYIICKYCTHVNGNHQDTLAFSKNIYQSDKINLQSQMLDIGHLSSLSQDALPALFEFSSKYEGGYLNTALACFVYQHNNFEPYGYSRNDTWQSFHYSKYVSMAIWNQIQQSESLTIPNVMFGEGYYSPYIMFENEKIYCWNNYFD